eukprot:287902-Pyramimonas_sp.AAC.1
MSSRGERSDGPGHLEVSGQADASGWAPCPGAKFVGLLCADKTECWLIGGCVGACRQGNCLSVRKCVGPSVH